MVNKKVDDYLETTKYWGPSNNTILSVHLFNKYDKKALDLGCGSLRNSKFLFNSGFIVDAIDKDPGVKKYTEFFKTRPKGVFNLKIADYIKFDLGREKYDIVVAQNSLSFNRKDEVGKVINGIYKTLKSDGIFAGNLYGLKDFRFGRNKMSFYTKDEVKSLLSKFKEVWLIEDEGGEKESGKKFHWHAYEFVVQKK